MSPTMALSRRARCTSPVASLAQSAGAITSGKDVQVPGSAVAAFGGDVGHVVLAQQALGGVAGAAPLLAPMAAKSREQAVPVGSRPAVGADQLVVAARLRV
jgi:hypothetical protein